MPRPMPRDRAHRELISGVVGLLRPPLAALALAREIRLLAPGFADDAERLALAVDLVWGFCGILSLGHAAFFGLGGYTVGILSAEGVASGWVQWPVALLVCAAWAAIASRTRRSPWRWPSRSSSFWTAKTPRASSTSGRRSIAATATCAAGHS